MSGRHQPTSAETGLCPLALCAFVVCLSVIEFGETAAYFIAICFQLLLNSEEEGCPSGFPAGVVPYTLA